MTTAVRIALATAAAAAALVACGGGDPAATPDTPNAPDGSGGVVTLPAWKLEDIQPASPRVGQTYGLDTFAGRIIAVTLVEGF